MCIVTFKRRRIDIIGRRRTNQYISGILSGFVILSVTTGGCVEVGIDMRVDIGKQQDVAFLRSMRASASSALPTRRPRKRLQIRSALPTPSSRRLSAWPMLSHSQKYIAILYITPRNNQQPKKLHHPEQKNKMNHSCNWARSFFLLVGQSIKSGADMVAQMSKPRLRNLNGQRTRMHL